MEDNGRLGGAITKQGSRLPRYLWGWGWGMRSVAIWNLKGSTGLQSLR